MINCKTYIYILDKQLQKKFKHASDFGIRGSCSLSNLNQFKRAIESHLYSSNTNVIKGNFRGKPVVHYFNPQTSLNVIFDDKGYFVSGWKLNQSQIDMIINTGNIGGS